MKRLGIAAVILGASLGLAPPEARAGISYRNATLNEFTGNDSVVSLTIAEDSAVANTLKFTLILGNPPGAGAVTAFWANLNPDRNMTGWSVADTAFGTTITSSFQASANNVNDLGGGANLNGGGSPAPLDFGVRFAGGAQGTTMVSFILTGNAASPVSLANFAGATYAARVQSIPWGEGSAKLKGTEGSPGPTPGPIPGVPDGGSAATLLGFSLFGLEALRRRLTRR